MTLSTKSSSKQQVVERKVKASRKVKVEPVHQEEVKKENKEEEPVLEVLEEKVLEPVLEVLEVPSINFESGANGPAPPLEEVSCPPCEEQIEEHEEVIVLAKKCAKVRPQVDENGNFLNPLTNRYVKFGSSNFKKLLRDGVIKPIELTGL
jgi:hypothetical protein